MVEDGTFGDVEYPAGKFVPGTLCEVSEGVYAFNEGVAGVGVSSVWCPAGGEAGFVGVEVGGVPGSYVLLYHGFN